MGQEVIAVFDLLRADRKFLLFDREYGIVFSREYHDVKIMDDDGEEAEDLQRLTSWIKNTFEGSLKNPAFDIQAVNVTTFGASFVHLDESGVPVTPLYSYLKHYPDGLLDQFYSQYGSREELAVETASPPLGMLNSGLQLYWLKYRKPEFFKKIKRSLHLPQYCSYFITGRRYSEITGIGCHTALWNFRENQYHRWVVAEGIDKLFPPIVPSDSYITLATGNKKVMAGVGIHDSSAALVPYLLNVEKPFILISTGTWSIAFNPFSKDLLTCEDLQRDCLYYLNFLGKPVKAGRLFLGNEHNYQIKRIAAHFQKSDTYYREVAFDKRIIQKLVSSPRAERQFIPETMDISSFIPDLRRRQVNLDGFDSFEEAYHQLNLDMVAMQALSLQLVWGETPIEELFIAGAFTENLLFIPLLATRFPQLKVYTSIISRATALGAASILHMHWNADRPFPGIGKIKWHPPVDDLQLEGYKLLP